MLYYGTKLSENISRRDSASSIVVTPHRGDYSFSLDLTADEISATGGRQRFALKAFRLNNDK